MPDRLSSRKLKGATVHDSFLRSSSPRRDSQCYAATYLTGEPMCNSRARDRVTSQPKTHQQLRTTSRRWLNVSSCAVIQPGGGRDHHPSSTQAIRGEHRRSTTSLVSEAATKLNEEGLRLRLGGTGTRVGTSITGGVCAFFPPTSFPYYCEHFP